jgi:predicted DNA-binding transcriptional regulator YafY
MLKFLLAISMIVVAGLAIVLAFILQEPQVSTLEIDRDRAALASQISAIQAESEQYGPGLLKSLVEVRLAITRNTQLGSARKEFRETQLTRT